MQTGTEGAVGRLCPPTRGQRPARGLWLRALALSFLCGFGLARCDGLSEDEVLCEESVAKLRECCGASFGGGIECYHADSGGCAAPRRPAVSRDKSLCLLRHSCDELRNGGSCDTETWTPMQKCASCRDLFNFTYRCCSDWQEPSCN